MQLKSKYKPAYKNKKSIRKSIFIIVSIVLLSGALGTGAYLLYYMNHKESTTASANETCITLYRADTEIKHGEIIAASMLIETKAIVACEEEHYSEIDCIGQVAIVDIPKGMPLMKNMCRLPEVEPGDREVECEIITLSDNLIENDYVDVRLMLPDGEDYIVLAKKGVHDLFKSEDGQEEICYLWLSEEEILYYSAAVVDAYLYQGASLYTTKYIEPNIQEASLVTYVPSLGTITMMKENPNLFDLALSKLKLEDRKLLENRLTDYLNLDIRERNWNVSSKEQNEVETDQSIDDDKAKKAKKDPNIIKDENAFKDENTTKEESATQDENTMKDEKVRQDQSAKQEDDEGTAKNDTDVIKEDKVDAAVFVED